MTFLEQMAERLTEFRRIAPPVANAREGYTLLLEALIKYWDEAVEEGDCRSDEIMLSVLVWLATECQRVAEDLCLCPRP